MDDAWKQLYDLTNHYTETWKVRGDIKVTAHATHRGVELNIADESQIGLALKQWTSTGKRNVNTFRELADAINAACDFVEEENPEWASRSLDDVSFTINYGEGVWNG